MGRVVYSPLSSRQSGGSVTARCNEGGSVAFYLSKIFTTNAGVSRKNGKTALDPSTRLRAMYTKTDNSRFRSFLTVFSGFIIMMFRVPFEGRFPCMGFIGWLLSGGGPPDQFFTGEQMIY